MNVRSTNGIKATKKRSIMATDRKVSKPSLKLAVISSVIRKAAMSEQEHESTVS